MKELYTAPELEIITFDSEDVITTSLTKGNNPGNPSGQGDIYIQ